MPDHSPHAFPDPDARLREAIAAFEQARGAGQQPDPREWLALYADVADQLAVYFKAASPEAADSVRELPEVTRFASGLQPFFTPFAEVQESTATLDLDERPDISWIKALGWLFLFFLIQAGCLIGLGILLAIASGRQEIGQNESTAVGFAVGQLLMAYLGWRWLGKEPGRKAAWRRISWLHFLLVLMLVPPLVLVSASIAEWTTAGLNQIFGTTTPATNLQAGYIEYFDRVFDSIARQPWAVMFLLGCILPALGEEIFFRAFLGRGLVARYGVVRGVLCTSVLFGLMHIDPVQISAVTILGIVAHWVYLSTGTLLGPMLLHFSYNAIGFTLRRLMLEDEFLPVGMDGSLLIAPHALAIAFVMLLAVLFALVRTRIRWLTRNGDEWSPGYVTAEKPPVSVGAEPCLGNRLSMPLLACVAGGYLTFAGLFLFARPNWLEANRHWLSFREADACVKQGQFEQALSLYTQAIDINPDYARVYLERGIAYHHLRRYDEAIRDYTEAIRLDPSQAITYENRAGCFNELGQSDKAIADATKAITLDPKQARSYTHRGVAYHRTRKYDLAVDDLSRAIHLGPPLALNHLERGIAFHNLRRIDEAISDYSEAIRLDASLAIAYENRAGCLNEKGDFGKSLADANQAIALNPGQARSYSTRGLAHQSLKEHDEAIKDFSEAIRLGQAQARDFLNRGVAYHNLRKYGEAIKDYTKAIELDPSVALAYENRANCLNDMGRFTDAITEATRAIQKDPKQARSHSLRGIAYLRLTKYQNAIEDLTRAIDLDPGQVRDYLDRGIAFHALQKFKEAISDYTEAIRLKHSLLAVVYENRAGCQVALGQFDEAISDATRAIELDRKQSRSFSHRGLAHQSKKMYDQAVQDFTNAIALGPPHFWDYHHRGWLYLHTKQFGKSLADCDAAIRLFAGFAQTHLHRGVVHQHLGKLKEAIADYTMAIKLDAKLVMAYENRALTYAAVGDDDRARADQEMAQRLKKQE